MFAGADFGAVVNFGDCALLDEEPII